MNPATCWPVHLGSCWQEEHTDVLGLFVINRLISLYSHGILRKPWARLDGESESSQPRPAVQGGISWLRALKSDGLREEIGLSPVWVVAELVAMLFFGRGDGP